MNSADLFTSKRIMSGTTSCCNCGSPMKPNDTDLCPVCTDELSSLFGSPVVDCYGIPKEETPD